MIRWKSSLFAVAIPPLWHFPYSWALHDSMVPQCRYCSLRIGHYAHLEAVSSHRWGWVRLHVGYLSPMHLATPCPFQSSSRHVLRFMNFQTTPSVFPVRTGLMDMAANHSPSEVSTYLTVLHTKITSTWSKALKPRPFPVLPGDVVEWSGVGWVEVGKLPANE